MFSDVTPSTNGDSDTVIPLDRKLSDYIEMIIYVLLIFGGGGVNLYVLKILGLQYRRRTVIKHVVCYENFSNQIHYNAVRPENSLFVAKTASHIC